MAEGRIPERSEEETLCSLRPAAQPHEAGPTITGYGTSYSYDVMGNMLSLSRYGDISAGTKGPVDNLTMTYDGNRLVSVQDAAQAVTMSGSMDYPDGAASVTDYRGNLVYKDGVLKDILTDLYYPYGMSYASSALAGSPSAEDGGDIQVFPGGSIPEIPGTPEIAEEFISTIPYRFCGKEQNIADGLGMYDFLARRYDPGLCRFTSPDPLAEKYPSVSPYAYCGNDPVNKVDPDGMDWYQKAGSNEYEWFVGNDDHENYTNVGQTLTSDGIYYSLFGEKVSTKDNDGNLAKVYEAIDNAIISYNKSQKDMQYSWDTEDNAISRIDINIETKGFNFTYAGHGFKSDLAECAPNSTSYSSVTGSIRGHKKLTVENMLSGPKKLMKSIVSDKWYQSPQQYPSLYWITLSGAEKSGRMIIVGFSKTNKDKLDTLINDQLKSRK